MLPKELNLNEHINKAGVNAIFSSFYNLLPKKVICDMKVGRDENNPGI